MLDERHTLVLGCRRVWDDYVVHVLSVGLRRCRHDEYSCSAPCQTLVALHDNAASRVVRLAIPVLGEGDRIIVDPPKLTLSRKRRHGSMTVYQMDLSAPLPITANLT